ncbi:MAG: hypothetical protein U5L08_16415 [Xanthomonadales bacterium]|nr:hypothetical protein [Xanthomonadales bacterium]
MANFLHFESRYLFLVACLAVGGSAAICSSARADAQVYLANEVATKTQGQCRFMAIQSTQINFYETVSVFGDSKKLEADLIREVSPLVPLTTNASCLNVPVSRKEWSMRRAGAAQNRWKLIFPTCVSDGCALIEDMPSIIDVQGSIASDRLVMSVGQKELLLKKESAHQDRKAVLTGKVSEFLEKIYSRQGVESCREFLEGQQGGQEFCRGVDKLGQVKNRRNVVSYLATEEGVLKLVQVSEIAGVDGARLLDLAVYEESGASGELVLDSYLFKMLEEK